jgi:membrane protein DedA with SNARE-associated domain
MALKFFTTIGLGILELWAAIPAGFAMGLHPVLVGLASGIGSVIGAVLIILPGARLREWLLRKKASPEKQKGRIYRIWDRYGVAGLGLLSPLLTGAPLGAAIGISLGASPGRLLFWMGLGIAAWTVLLTALGAFGISMIR